MTKQYGIAPQSIDDLRQFYDEEFKRTLIKDEDRAYAWMAHSLFKPYVEGKFVLDLGCGGGYFTQELRKIARGAIGMDLSKQALTIATERNPIEYLAQGSAEFLPFNAESFDSVFCLGSLEHFADIPGAITEMKRIVKKDGWIFVMVPNLFWYKDILSVLKTGDIGHRNQRYEFFATKSQWLEIIKDTGVSVEKIWKYNGISKSPFKQWWKDLLIPFNLSYHIIFGFRPSITHAF